MSEAPKIIDKLRAIRERTDLKLKPTPHLKTTFTDFSGNERDLTIRYYQVQGILHLIFMKRFLLGDDTGLGKCKNYASLVLTDQGLIPLGELEDWSGMEADSFRPMSHPVHVLVDGKPRLIKNYYYGGVKPTITTTTRYGFRTTGSLIHPMLVLREGRHQWVETQAIKEGDYLCVDRREMPFPEEEPLLVSSPGSVTERMTPTLARFLGYYIGEGSLTSKNQVQVSQCPIVNPEVHADINRMFELVFGRRPNRPKIANLYLSDVKLRRWLAANGLDYCRSSGRSVPPCILQGTKVSNQEFLRALFEGDGHASKTHIEYSTASEELGHQIQIMLLRFGVVSNRSIKKVKSYPDSTYWRLTICGDDAQRFQDEIGFISTRKVAALRACLDRPRNTNHDVIPEIQWIFEQVRVDLLEATSRLGANADRTGSGLKQFGASLVNTLNNIRDFGRNPSYTFIENVVRLLEEQAPGAESLSLLRAFLGTRYFYDPVVRLEKGAEEVFDIEVDDPSHSFVADGVINHNTLQSIAALCFLWEREPSRKVLVLTTKSATPQWAKEFAKFTKGVRVIVANGTRQQRETAYAAWRKSDKPTVMVMGYRSAVNDLRKIQGDHGYILITDEATAYKNPKTQVHQVVRHLSSQADRTWALTATLIKNHLMEGHGIYQVVVPGLFGSVNSFMYYYCIVEMMMVGGGRKVPRIIGYFPEKVGEFRDHISPYYLGRPKHQVAAELPPLTREVVEVGVTKEQEVKYREAMAGLLTVGGTKGEEEEKEVTKLTALIYHQEILDHPALIGCEGESEKLTVLMEMLTEGDLAEDKVIIFTRFSKMVDLLMPELKKAGLEPVRVTGAETGSQRQKAQDTFQNPDNPCRAICITSAGGEAINLQAAKAIVFYDTPWSAGEYLQCLDSQTEILTRRGFVGRLAVRDDDLVAAFDPGTSAITWQVIRSRVDRSLAENEAMYELSSPHLDIRVTGGHRMLFKRQKSTAKKQRYWPTEWRFQVAAELADEKSVYRLPACGVQEASGAPLTDDEVRFIGWFLTDGTMNKKNHQVRIYQANHQPQIKDLRQCLAGCGFDWKEYPRDPTKISGTYLNGQPQTAFTIPKGTGSGSRKREGWNHLAAYLDKDLSPNLEALDTRQLGVLLEASHLGDGAKMLGQTWTRRSYHVTTGSKVFADRLQSLCVRRGYRCNVVQRPGKQTFILHIKPTSFWSLQGSVSQGRPRMGPSKSVPGEPVWCVQNDVGTLITRRNGKVAVVGNCLGRIIRIGSEHDRVLAIHLVAKIKGVPTVDQKVMEVIEKKLKLIEAVLGERLKGEGTPSQEILTVTSDVNDLFDALKAAGKV